MDANSEVPRSNATIAGLSDLYIEKILKPCLNVPIGGTEDPDARMGYKCADSYRLHLRNRIIPRWKDHLISDFERAEIWSIAEDWFRSLLRSPKNPGGLAPKSVRLIFATMGQLMRYAVKWGYLSQNPFVGKEGKERRIDPPRGSTLRLTKANQLTPEQTSQLVAYLPLREKSAATLSAWLETRSSETFGLKWMDFDLNAPVVRLCRGVDAGRITQGKTAASNTKMPVPQEVVEVLCAWHAVTPYNKPDDWVFPSCQKNGKNPMYPHSLMKNIQAVARKLGLPHVTWYSFRHSLNALAKECLPREERRIMIRHGNTATEEGYGEVPLERKREIAQRLWTRMRERMGNVPDPARRLEGATGHNEPTLVVDPNQSPAPSGSPTSILALVGQAPALIYEHKKRSVAARKAWETIRAKRLATSGPLDPSLTQMNNERSRIMSRLELVKPQKRKDFHE